MNICKECGFELTEKSNFCPNCGKKILQEPEKVPEILQEEAEESIIICPDCSQENEINAKFCMACGSPLHKQQHDEIPITCNLCGVVNPPGSDYCGGCGAALGRKEAVTKTVETDSLFNLYLRGLDERMKGDNYRVDHEEEKKLDCIRVYRQDAKLSKLGKSSLDLYFAITWQQTELDTATLRQFVNGIFRQLEKRKNLIMKSLQPLAIFPVVVTVNAGKDAEAFISNYCAPHLGIMEFPVIVELNNGKVLYYKGNPMWGGPFYKKARNMADSLLVPA